MGTGLGKAWGGGGLTAGLGFVFVQNESAVILSTLPEQLVLGFSGAKGRCQVEDILGLLHRPQGNQWGWDLHLQGCLVPVSA